MFVIDNADTMEPSWWEAKFLLETLLEKARGLDENGIDVMFTIGSDKDNLQNQKGKSKIMALMNNMGARPQKGHGNHTDMTEVLGKIFKKYIVHAKRNTHYKLPVNNLTLIVLTDGIWAGTRNKHEVSAKIVNFSKELERTIGSLEERPVSIQFIQFGYDIDATARLKALDDNLIYLGIP